MTRPQLACLLGALLFVRDDSIHSDRSLGDVTFSNQPVELRAGEPATVVGANVALRPIEDYFPVGSSRRCKFQVKYHSLLSSGEGHTTSIMEAGFMRHGNEYYRVTFESAGVPGLDKVVLFYRLGEQGLLQLSDDRPAAAESLLIPRALAIGRRWEVHDRRIVARCQILGLESVVCQGRRFDDCLRLRTQSDGMFGKGTEERWLAPGVGTVKQTYSGKWFSFESELVDLPATRP